MLSTHACTSNPLQQPMHVYPNTHSQAPNYDRITTGPVDSYMLTYRIQSGGAPTSLILLHQATDRTVGSLEKGTVYVFTITALNIAGSGDSYVFPSTTTLVDREYILQEKNYLIGMKRVLWNYSDKIFSKE